MSDESIQKVRQAALEYLGQHTVFTLATKGPAGVWAAALFYANEGFNLYFLSAGHTRHGQNMESDRRVAGTIQENYIEWPDIKGLQFEGSVTVLAGHEQEEAIALYGSKYPIIKSDDGPIIEALKQLNWYRLTLDSLFMIDNSKSFGHRDEVKLIAP